MRTIWNFKDKIKNTAFERAGFRDCVLLFWGLMQRRKALKLIFAQLPKKVPRSKSTSSALRRRGCYEAFESTLFSQNKKDIFATFAYDFEHLRFLVKSFACAHGEIKGSRLW